MARVDIAVESPIERSPRVQQVEGIFDLAAVSTSRVEWTVDLPLDEKPWSIGLIVGPSGCGKSTIARALWPSAYFKGYGLAWSNRQAILDGWAEAMPVKEVIELLCSVGFSSPPAWLRPFHVLSTGQQFRVTLARLLAETNEGHGGREDPGTALDSVSRIDPRQPSQHPPLVVFDEFTSVVDRTVAQIASAALAKTVRRRGQQFVAVTCHEDVEAWLNPDWVYTPAENHFSWRCLQRRPSVCLDVFRSSREAWPLFAPHHYLSDHLSHTATCFIATWNKRPVAFSAWINDFTRAGGRREHRTVTLPDYQGGGIGHALSSLIASLWKARGCRAVSTTTHPAFIASRRRDPNWKMIRAPGIVPREGGKRKGFKHANTRLAAGFEYRGPALDPEKAEVLYGVS